MQDYRSSVTFASWKHRSGETCEDSKLVGNEGWRRRQLHRPPDGKSEREGPKGRRSIGPRIARRQGASSPGLTSRTLAGGRWTPSAA